MKHLRPLWGLVALFIVSLAACRTPGATTIPTLAPSAATAPADAPAQPPTSAPTRTPPPAVTEPTATVAPRAEPTAEPTVEATIAAEPSAPADGLPPAVSFDLGETTIVQSHFSEDSRFRNMPVRLNGVMAVPATGEAAGPFPVVVIMHGTHPGCPLVGEVDVWPCGDEEQANYAGFEYLVRELAGRGYVALAINVNAENTFGFGEPVMGERLSQIVDRHLSALAEAAAGGENAFGLALAGLADVHRLAFIGHSSGGQNSGWLTSAGDLGDPLSAAERGFGPVAGVLMVAPPLLSNDALVTSVPLAVILPACDGDVSQLDGQHYYEAMRFAGEAHPWATTVVLEQANHNAFNMTLPPDPFADPTRPGCATLLEPEAQRAFLVDYADAFLTALFAPDEMAQAVAMTALAMDAQMPAPAEVFGLPARVSALAAADDRLTLFAPADETELTTHVLGGATTAEGLMLTFCPPGFNFEIIPGQEPCRRRSLLLPAYPALAVANWTGPDAALRLALLDGVDLSGFTALSLRAAVDPMSEFNAAGAYQAFSVQLTDGAGNTATVPTRPDEPALRFPEGETQASDFIAEGLFTGKAALTTLRLPLSDFAGIDLTDVREVTLLFDQTPSGALFLADVEAIRN